MAFCRTGLCGDKNPLFFFSWFDDRASFYSYLTFAQWRGSATISGAAKVVVVEPVSGKWQSVWCCVREAATVVVGGVKAIWEPQKL